MRELQRIVRADRKSAMVHGADFVEMMVASASTAVACAGGALEQIAVRTGAGQFKNENVLMNMVDEKPIGSNVTFAMICPTASERVVTIRGRQCLAVPQLLHNCLQLFNGQMPFQRQFVVAFEGCGVADGIFHFVKSFHMRSRLSYDGQFGSCAMRSPSSIAAIVSALGTCDPSMMKGIRFSRMTVLMYTVMTEEADNPTSSQKCVKRSFVRLSSDIVMLAIGISPPFACKARVLYRKVA